MTPEAIRSVAVMRAKFTSVTARFFFTSGMLLFR
jgi:hypothetical protein